MKNALKIMIKEMLVLFCKYLRKESLDLLEILCGGQLLSCELNFKFDEDSCINARPRVVNVHTRFIASARVYDSCTHSCARIFMKLKT